MAKTFYETMGKAQEYAPIALELYESCQHSCAYCYNTTKPKKYQKKAETFFTEGKPISGIVEAVEKKAFEFERYIDPKMRRRVLMCFGSDPYQEAERKFEVTRRVLEILDRNKVPFQVLTKNPALALRDLDVFKRAGGHLATTVLFLDEALRDKWEPGAPKPLDRLYAMKVAHENGVYTWASVEPVVDPVEALKVIERASPYIDLWKVGRLNYVEGANDIDWKKFAFDVVKLLKSLNKNYIIKKDLAVFLPDNIPARNVP